MLAAILRPVPDEHTPPTMDAQVRAAVDGDPDAQAVLLRRLLPRVRNLVRYLIRGDVDVDDIAQDALVEILQSLPRYTGTGKIESWADRIVARTTFNRIRRRRTRDQRFVSKEPELLAVPAKEAGPDRYFARRQFVALLEELPEAQRDALVLHHAVGMSAKEVGEALSVSHETVRSRLKLGAARLRKMIAEREGHEVAR